jgi:hypothetical protein
MESDSQSGSGREPRRVLQEDTVLCILAFQSYDEIDAYLRNWSSFNDPQVYDFGGIVHLMVACLDNIAQYGLEAELEDLPHYLTSEQQQFIIRIAAILQAQ